MGVYYGCLDLGMVLKSEGELWDGVNINWAEACGYICPARSRWLQVRGEEYEGGVLSSRINRGGLLIPAPPAEPELQHFT